MLSLEKNQELKSQIEKRKISWQNDFDVVRKIFNEIKNSDIYQEYQASSQVSVEEDRNFIISIITEYLSENDVLASLFEEKNIHWADDAFVRLIRLYAILKRLRASSGSNPC